MLESSTLTRRDFMRSAAAAATATLIAPTIVISRSKAIVRGQGEVVLSRDPLATIGIEKINDEVVQTIVDKGIVRFTGLDKIGAAWKSLFPVLDKQTIIGIKVNCVAGERPRQLCTQVATVNAIVNGLEQMPIKGGHFPRNNILVWDRWDEEMEGVGYKLNETGPGEKVAGISKTMEDKSPRYGYDGAAAWKSLEDTAYFTSILSKVCHYQINVPVLKRTGRGVTFAMKNMYGNFSSAYPYWADIGTVFHKEFHTRMCDLNAAPLTREKFVLHVGDALLGMKNRGPVGPADFSYGAALFSKDPVALDAVGVKIIREQGQEMEFPQFMTMAQERGLGVADLERIKIEKL
jgi:hypothetical protein